MLKRRTSRRSRRSGDRQLALKVTSPRIFLFDCLKFGRSFFKLGVIIVVLGGLVIGAMFGWKKLFVENDEFQIQHFVLKTFSGEDPSFVTHRRLMEEIGIVPGETVFSIDADEIEGALLSLPEVTEARVTRRLPDRLRIEIKERDPVAWVVARPNGPMIKEPEMGLLLDSSGVTFECSSDEVWRKVKDLPLICLSSKEMKKVGRDREVELSGLAQSLELVKIASESLESTEQPVWIAVMDEIHLQMKTRSGIVAKLSYYDLERQLTDLHRLVIHAELSGEILEEVNLVPSKLIPVKFRGRS